MQDTTLQQEAMNSANVNSPPSGSISETAESMEACSVDPPKSIRKLSQQSPECCLLSKNIDDGRSGNEDILLSWTEEGFNILNDRKSSLSNSNQKHSTGLEVPIGRNVSFSLPKQMNSESTGSTGLRSRSVFGIMRRWQDNKLPAYDVGSIHEIKTRRSYLNFHKLQRMADEDRPMSRWDRWKVQLHHRITKERKKSKQIHIPPSEDAITLYRALRLMIHCSFHDLIIWQIITSYSNFFFFQFLFYFVWVYTFAFLIYGCTIFTNEQCLSMAGNVVRGSMEYAFELSWTTFGTVGYGVASPSANLGCYSMRYLCAIESAVGILYFSLVGAIFFGRVSRILSRAPVTFSSPLCIQYDNTCREGIASHLSDTTPNYPTLEFRIVHNKANTKGWEILDVKLKCMVAIDTPSSHEKDLSVLFVVEGSSEHENDIPNQTYHKVQLEADTHPYFKRVWHCRHVLNDQSPLLSKSVRNEIRRLGGWPRERGSPVAVRSALIKFKTMIVTLTGTSNITSSGVFIEQRYAFEDIFVGWKFAGLIYLKTCSLGQKMMVDLSLTHDIRPQGDGEEESPRPDRLLPLRPKRLKSGDFQPRINKQTA